MQPRFPFTDPIGGRDISPRDIQGAGASVAPGVIDSVGQGSVLQGCQEASCFVQSIILPRTSPGKPRRIVEPAPVGGAGHSRGSYSPEGRRKGVQMAIHSDREWVLAQ